MARPCSRPRYRNHLRYGAPTGSRRTRKWRPSFEVATRVS